MPITITITDPTPEQIAALFGVHPYLDAPTIDKSEPDKPKATRASTKKPPVADGGVQQAAAMSPEDVELAREIAADVAEAPPEPKGATMVVDGGTGRPIAPATDTVLTMDEVRANATRLAQANAPQLKAILGEFGAAKLSEVPADKLPDFAGRVLEALD